MTTVTKMLMEDHRKVEELFAQFEKSEKPQIAQQICDELKIHTTLEEERVYPILESKVDKDMAQEANQEHKEADALIKQVEGAMTDKARLSSLMTELKAAIEHHVAEEEDEVFPKMDREVGGQLEAITNKFLERKEQLTNGTA